MKKISLLTLIAICSFFSAPILSYAQIVDPAPYSSADFDDHLGVGDPVVHYISNVTLGSWNHSTGTTPYPAGHYVYYNTLTGPTVVRGNSYTLSVDHDGSPNTHFFSVYIDYNNDGDFDDAGELVSTYGPMMVPNPATAIITIPTSASIATTRMRVMVFEDTAYTMSGPAVPTSTTVFLESAPLLDYGETEDYNITIEDATTCGPVSDVMLSVGTTAVHMSWDAVSGASGYEWEVNTSSSAPTGSGTFTTETTASISTLTPSTDYYAHVRVRCGASTYSSWVSVPFTTRAPEPCDTATSLAVTGITETSAILSWNTMPGAAEGYEYTITTTPDMPTTAGTNVSDTTVSVGTLSPGSGYYAFVRVKCSSSTYSDWVSVPFTTLTATVCDTVTALSVSDITSTTATANWSAITGVEGYEYVVNTTAADPTAAGTFTATATAVMSSLIPATTYYFHLRTKCSSTSFSDWIVVPFTTASVTATCDTVASITFTTILPTSVTFTWPAVTGSLGYNYVVNASASAPSVSGTYTTATTATVSGLTAGTVYYAHVKDSCAVGLSSDWITRRFQTTVGVHDVGKSNIVSVYPNPTTDVLFVKVDATALNLQTTVNIIDMSGRVVIEKYLTDALTPIDMKQFSSGTYFVKISNANFTEHIRFVKQ